ncbi:MAG: TIGR04100 family radical SAM protein [Clostridiales bacterium]|nr:TIGR04100 family radical SAM protein [Clostridiales bacterium]
MENILYTYGNKIYMNITNRCPCACEFCVRRNEDGLGDMGSLWLDHEPTFEEIKEAVDSFDFSGYENVVFCGFGEPTCALENMLKTAKYLKSTRNVSIRLNTNGLSDLINNCDNSAERMHGLVDAVSVSLNASDAEKYNAVVHPKFGEKSFDAMIRFAKDCQKYIPSVKMTVVNTIGGAEIEKCKKLCADNGIELRVRTYIK